MRILDAAQMRSVDRAAIEEWGFPSLVLMENAARAVAECVYAALLDPPGSQVLLLTGSGMGFQNQRHLAAAMWKGLRESPTPLPATLRLASRGINRSRHWLDPSAGRLAMSCVCSKFKKWPRVLSMTGCT